MTIVYDTITTPKLTISAREFAEYLEPVAENTPFIAFLCPKLLNRGLTNSKPVRSLLGVYFSSTKGIDMTTQQATITYEIELVHIVLYDAGRSIDLKQASVLLPGITAFQLSRRRDTPITHTMPNSILANIDNGNTLNGTDSRSPTIKVMTRIYAEGVISVIVRLFVNTSIENLHGDDASLTQGQVSLDALCDQNYHQLIHLLEPAISRENYPKNYLEKESYTAYCLADTGTDPYTFVLSNKSSLTTLLSGESSSIKLHTSQIEKSLSNPFSYTSTDLAIFDMDKCLIIDTTRDYEDILLIAELANYQFLELRTLDRLLDQWLDDAEDDVKLLYNKKSTQKIVPSNPFGSRTLKQKLAVIQRFRLDALFILENLENSSKIIGDYFLGDIYGHMCRLFNTAGWTQSIERRIDALQHIYEIINSDRTDRNMLVLEIIFIIVCIIPIIQVAFG